MNGGLKAELASIAREQGFVAFRVAEARENEEARRIALERIEEGQFSGLPWFTSERVTRATTPESTVAGSRSIVLLAAAYSRSLPRPKDGRLRGRISRYAWGRDYHRVLEKRARPLLARLGREPGSQSRFLVDHGPLMERAYAHDAGVGWQGKNAMVLTPGIGSYTFLAAILTTVPLEPDPPLRQSCGRCARCLPSCPTGALRGAYEVVNDLCIAYQTIENRGSIPRALRPMLRDWVFGCDLCQEPCPVNETNDDDGLEEFRPEDPEAAYPDLVAVIALDEATFRRRYEGRPVMRARFPGFLRNVCVALGNSRDERAVEPLERALRHPEALVRGHAAWGLGQLAERGALRDALPAERDAAVREEIQASLETIG